MAPLASFQVTQITTFFLLLHSLVAMALTAVASATDDVLADIPLWGTYRPHALMSVRARVPHSPVFGLAYHPAASTEIRHLAADHQSAIRAFGFSRHDGRSFGDQQIEDADVNTLLSYSFIRHDQDDAWAIRISGKPYDDRRDTQLLSLVFYASAGPEELDSEALNATNTNQDSGNAPWGYIELDPQTTQSADGVLGHCTLQGSSNAIGGAYKVVVKEPRMGSIVVKDPHDASEEGLRRRRRTRAKASQHGPDLARFHVSSRKSDPKEAFMVDTLMKTLLLESQDAQLQAHLAMDDGTSAKEVSNVPITLLNEVEHGAPTVLVQRVVSVPFEMDILFYTTESKTEEQIAGQQRFFSAESVGQNLKLKRQAFDTRFENVFGLKQLGYTKEDVEFSRSALANLLGGIGYFYGGTPVRSESSVAFRSPIPLFTSTPSRATFPRGFLWDEGFHQLIIQRWDPDLSRACLLSWFHQMDSSGWIPREQVLGVEARVRFPSHVHHLMIQDPTVANPPTILMPLKVFAKWESANASLQDVGASETCCTVSEDDQECSCRDAEVGGIAPSPFWSELLDKTITNYKWLIETQAGQLPNSFRWRGRDSGMRSPQGYPLTLASGLDDFPRGFESNIYERHVDLHSWAAWGASVLADLHRAARRPSDEFEYLKLRLTRALEEHHGQDGNDVDTVVDSNLLCDFDGRASICEEGYVTALPLLLGLLDVDSPRVGAILGMLEDRDKLRSPAGIRSLSKRSEFYHKGDDYWTGSVWMPFNYLTLAALYTKYGKESGPYRDRARDLYDSLKTDILLNARAVFESTGYLWENYNSDDGRGKSARQFTGWSSLVVLIYADLYEGVL